MKKKPVKVSHSKVQVYAECGRKYYYQYVEHLEADKTFTPLLFGISIDVAINYMLETLQKNKEINVKTARDIFIQSMKTWHGQNELVYSKVDAAGLENPTQEEVWENLCRLGEKMLMCYHNEIIPLIDEVLEVQTKQKIYNSDGDELTFVLDFVAKLKDGRIVLFDNKTSSAPYPKNAVKESVQLSIYSNFMNMPLCGYIVLQKKLNRKGEVKWQMIIDEINDDKVDEVFDFLETLAQGIKEEKYEKNTKACWKFGRRCVYYDLCHNGDDKGLKKRKKK